MTPLFALIILALTVAAVGANYLAMYLRYRRVIRRRLGLR